MVALGPIAERLAANRYLLDEAQSHISLDQEAARRTGAGAMLVRVCAAHV